MFNKRIIAIHDVADDTMTAARFEKIIKATLALGYKFVSIDEILKPETKGLKVCLTVDDAYKSTITTIIDILEKYKIKSLLYVPTGLLGHKANDKILMDNDCYKNKDMMTWDDIKQWVDRGQEIGFHTHNHIDMYYHSKEEIAKDFKIGMEAFKAQGYTVSHFAYPKGHLPQDREHAEKLFQEYGIKYARSVNRGKVNPKNKYYIHGTLLGNKEPFLWTMCKILGLEDWHYYLVKQKKGPEVKE